MLKIQTFGVAVAAAAALTVGAVPTATAQEGPAASDGVNAPAAFPVPMANADAFAFYPAKDASAHYAELSRYVRIYQYRDMYWRHARTFFHNAEQLPEWDFEPATASQRKVALARLFLVIAKAEGNAAARSIDVDQVGIDEATTAQAREILVLMAAEARVLDLEVNGYNSVRESARVKPVHDRRVALSYAESGLTGDLPLDAGPYTVLTHGSHKVPLSRSFLTVPAPLAKITVTTSAAWQVNGADDANSHNRAYLDGLGEDQNPFPQSTMQAPAKKPAPTHVPAGPGATAALTGADQIAFTPAQDAAVYYPEIADAIAIYRMRELYWQGAVAQHEAQGTEQSTRVLAKQSADLAAARVRVLIAVMRAEGDQWARGLDLTSTNSFDPNDAVRRAYGRMSLGVDQALVAVATEGSAEYRTAASNRLRWFREANNGWLFAYRAFSYNGDDAAAIIVDHGVEAVYLPAIPADLAKLTVYKPTGQGNEFAAKQANHKVNVEVLAAMPGRTANPFVFSTFK